MRCLLVVTATLAACGPALSTGPGHQPQPELEPLATLVTASWRSLAAHSRSRRNLNELGGHGHHGHHSTHGDHGDHGAHDAHGNHEAHADHGAHGDHGDHGSHAGHGAAGDHGAHGTHEAHRQGAKRNDEVSVWTLIGHTDKFGCVAKFTCLLEAKHQQRAMTSQEAIVHRYITKQPSESHLEEMSILKAPYYFAAFVGNRFGGQMCNRFFPDCHHDFPEMLQFVNNFNIVPRGESS